MAFYLKYRPQKIADFDLMEVRDKVGRILQSNHLPHAFLFAGPRGVGKTSMARLVAKSLNCPNVQKGEPCGQCEVCRAIAKGNFLDILEIDAASNRGIDDIRDLKEKVNLAPSRGKYKVYIIDEVHMLTPEAFNALLKTLEEPPEKVVFILCTTNPEKLPETILSRCVRINFNKATDKEIMSALKKAAEGEKLAVEEGALEEIVRLADGSFRDAQKILEELSFLGPKIEARMVKKMAGLDDSLAPASLLDFLAAGKLQEAVAMVEKINQRGLDIQAYLEQLLRELRLLLHGLWGLPDGKKSAFSSDQLFSLVDIFSQAARQAKQTSVPILALEVAAGKAAALLEAKKGGGNNADTSFKDFKAKEGKKASGSVKKEKEKLGEEKKIKINDEVWQEILTKVRPQNHSVEAFLKSAQPLSFEDQSLTIGVYYSFHKECLEREVNRRIVEKAVGEVLGEKAKVFFKLSPKSPPKQQRVNKEKTQDNEEDLVGLAEKIFGGEENV